MIINYKARCAYNIAMKTSTQLKALIHNLSKEKNINSEILIRNFMLERLLERISLSKYKDMVESVPGPPKEVRVIPVCKIKA